MVPRYRPMEERILKFSRKETLREASQAAGIGQFLSFRRKPESSSIFLDLAGPTHRVKPRDDRFRN
jgi:hypothetical protein